MDVRAAWRFVGGKMPALATLVDLAGEGPLNEEERDTIGAALSSVRDPTVKGTLLENLIALSVALRYEVRAVPSTAGGRPVRRSARSALQKVARIVERATLGVHAPKTTALLLWLTGCKVAPEREGEGAAAYVARATRVVEKRARVC